MKSKISVIIPFYNAVLYAARCLDSIIAQDIGIEHLQVICVDDASTDDTVAILKSYQKRYPDSIEVIESSVNKRQGGARNLGIKAAKAEYITFVDSDDWIEKDMYSKMYNTMLQNPCDFVYCRHIRDNGKSGNLYLKEDERRTEEQDVYVNIEESQAGDFLVSDVVGSGVWDKLFRKSFFIENDIVFPEGIVYEDIYFAALLYMYARTLCILNEKLYHYFVNEESTVLKKNTNYHLDLLKVNQLKWEKYKQTGFFDKFPAAVEYDFIKTFYLAGMKMLFLRFDKPSYDLFLLLKNETKKTVPAYKENPYLKGAFTEVYNIMLDMLETPIDENEFYQIAKAMKQYINAGNKKNE